MKERKTPILALTALLVAASSAYSREKPAPSGPPFKYAGGTENVEPLCEGNLELGSQVLTFKCSTGSSVTIPYDSIAMMQYRPDVSKKVWKMKPKWKVRPVLETPLMGSKRNRYFTVVYTKNGAAHAMILDVLPDAMRPYLAEIDLKAGKRVEVKSFETYD
jgi:hypothetical protein